jgi:hypothetical protein
MKLPRRARYRSGSDDAREHPQLLQGDVAHGKLSFPEYEDKIIQIYLQAFSVMIDTGK